MRTLFAILLSLFLAAPLFAIPIDYRIGGHMGWIMPDGKVDKVAEQPDQWIFPAWGIDISATFHPDWQALRLWNNAGIGAGLSYWHLPHPSLGQAFTPYTYLDIPLFSSPHFVLGIRPGIGAAFMTKTYRNTIPEDHLFVDVQGANECIGSIANLYFPEVLYLDFPIARGWTAGVSGGWYHISNGSVRQPNSGYNIFAAELAVKHTIPHNSTLHNTTPHNSTPHNTTPHNTILHNTTQHNTKPWSIAISATAGGRQVYYRDQQTFFVASMHAAAYWHAHPIFHLGGGLDAFYDGAYIQRQTYFQKTNLSAAQPADCWRLGVSIQPEFVVGKFTTGIHIGAYLLDPVKELEPYNEAILSPTGRINKPIFYPYNLLKAGSAGHPDGWLYTMVVLRYHLPWQVFLQAMMKSHLTKVEFVSLGIGFYY